jgi:hypothetical protein
MQRLSEQDRRVLDVSNELRLIENFRTFHYLKPEWQSLGYMARVEIISTNYPSINPEIGSLLAKADDEKFFDIIRLMYKKTIDGIRQGKSGQEIREEYQNEISHEVIRATAEEVPQGSTDVPGSDDSEPDGPQGS